jgi:hypothetical protein
MPSWKKVITSGSAAAFSSLIVSNTITGSLSGSLTGSLQGTASWATNAQTSSYILSSNVYGPNGFDSISYASSAGSAGTATTATNADTASYISLPYKIYTAVFSGSAGSDPDVTVLENTLGADLTWVNSGPNSTFKISSSIANTFPDNKTYFSVNIVSSSGAPLFGTISKYSDDELRLFPYNLLGGLSFNVGGGQENYVSSIEIKVFS